MKRFLNHACHVVKLACHSDLKTPSGYLAFILVLGAGYGMMTPSHADAYGYDNSNAQSGFSQSKAIWYRYYVNGQPSLSTTVTEQHMRYGYEALDRNMQVIRRVPPYSAASYERQRAKQDAITAQYNADMNLRRAYGSVAQAIAKRDQIISDMESRKVFLQRQLADLQTSLDKSIAQAASYERQRKPVPPYLQNSLTENRKNVASAEQNIKAIAERQQQTRTQYEQIIERLGKL